MTREEKKELLTNQGISEFIKDHMKNCIHKKPEIVDGEEIPITRDGMFVYSTEHNRYRKVYICTCRFCKTSYTDYDNYTVYNKTGEICERKDLDW